MKTILTTILLLIASINSLTSQNEETAELKVTFNVTKHNKGVIYLSIYDSEESYMKKSYKASGVYVKDNKATFIFKGIKKGTYSFSYYHDVNSNKKLDKNFMGIPKEPYGFSNDQAGRFGPPSFKAAKIEINKNTEINLEIK